MKIKRFTAKRVHGYLDFDVPFFPDRTFLTGINGSGKTTVVRSIAALLSPSYSVLAATEHDSMQVEIEEQGIDLSIASCRSQDTLTLSSSAVHEPVQIPILPERPDSPPEKIAEYYRDQETRNADRPLAKFLHDLPNPMVLGLERRSEDVFPGDDRDYYLYMVRRRTRTLSSLMARSLIEAAVLAEWRCRDINVQLLDNAERLRKQLLLLALRYQSPEQVKLQRLPKMKDLTKLKVTLAGLGFTEEEISTRVDPFIDSVKEISKFQPFNEPLGKVFEQGDQAKSNAYMAWYLNRPHFDRIAAMIKAVRRYNAIADKTAEPLQQYLAAVNRFLHDSDKELIIDASEQTLQVRISGTLQRPVNALSSGESQLVVILTHLAFNPAVRRANVFIVDEPELSLHLAWQELFVEAVQTVNPEIQSIMATHAPAIILDDVEHCVDLSRRKK